MRFYNAPWTFVAAHASDSTRLDLNKMAAILQSAFSNIYIYMK